MTEFLSIHYNRKNDRDSDRNRKDREKRMRVIAGKARRLQLKTVRGDQTRPTTDRIKETLFNMLQEGLPGARFLDLFAGSGAIGIEALSRDAAYAVFVENNPAAAACIHDNLLHTHLEDQAQVLKMDVLHAIDRLEQSQSIPFTYIFMDPPYDRGWEKRILSRLQNSSLADENTILIIEASLVTDFDYLGKEGYQLLKEKNYKSNKHIFVRKRGLTI